MKWNIATGSCCVLLLVMNVALIRQNRQLKEQASRPSPTLQLSPGAQVQELRGFDLAGRPLQVAYGDDQRKVLVFVFSPTCPFCAENWPKWQALFPALDRNAVRPVAVDVTSTVTPAFVSQYQLANMPVFARVDPGDLAMYHLQITPQTILVGHDAKVEKVWSGVLTAASVEEINRLANRKN